MYFKTVHVPYKGAVLAVNDLITGQLQFIIASPIVVMPHAKSGRIKAIATTGARRDPFLPELPAAADVLPGFEITAWSGVAVPAKTPVLITTKLHGEIVKAMQSAEARDALARQSATAHAESPGEFSSFIKAERARIARVGRQASITLD
jgi:tripartite-type tricarboxylate transporter receptor subunit TctC